MEFTVAFLFLLLSGLLDGRKLPCSWAAGDRGIASIKRRPSVLRIAVAYPLRWIEQYAQRQCRGIALSYEERECKLAIVR